MFGPISSSKESLGGIGQGRDFPFRLATLVVRLCIDSSHPVLVEFRVSFDGCSQAGHQKPNFRAVEPNFRSRKLGSNF